MVYFFGPLSYTEQAPDGYVYILAVTTIVFFNIFLVNMVVHKDKVTSRKEYLFKEGVHLFLNLLGKTALICPYFLVPLHPDKKVSNNHVIRTPKKSPGVSV